MPKARNESKPKNKIYQVFLINHGKKIRTLYIADTVDKALKKMKELEEESKSVKFPIKWNNEKTEIVPSEYEIVLAKYGQGIGEEPSMLRNEFGKFVNYRTESNDWTIIEKQPHDIEETFWVYGYHPRLQRKNYEWIMDNIVLEGTVSKYSIRMVVVFYNKLLVEKDGKLEMVICKNIDDAVRLYNQLSQDIPRNLSRYILFMGNASLSRIRTTWLEKVINLTHWTRKKITRTTTRPEKKERSRQAFFSIFITNCSKKSSIEPSDGLNSSSSDFLFLKNKSSSSFSNSSLPSGIVITDVVVTPCEIKFFETFAPISNNVFVLRVKSITKAFQKTTLFSFSKCLSEEATRPFSFRSRHPSCLDPSHRLASLLSCSARP